MSDSRIFIPSDGHRLAYNLWVPENREVKAFVQIVHGLSEYSIKYEQFAKYLNKKGYVVFASDLRGYGYSSLDDTVGYFADHDGWDRVCKDVFEVSRYISTIFHAKKVFLVGSGMGGTIVRTVMMEHPDFYTGVAAVNPEKSLGLIGKIEAFLTGIQRTKKGPKEPNKYAEKRFFQNMPARKNPLCDFVCSNSMYVDYIKGLEVANDGSRINKLPKDLPILLVSEKANKDSEDVFNKYRNAGIIDLTMKSFEEKKEAHDIIYKWLENHI